MAMTRVSRSLGGSLRARLEALRQRPRWELIALCAIVVLTAFLYLWALSRNGMGNSYYAAAVKSGSVSWKAFLFGSLDPGNFITVDKTPAAFWVPALFARVFGFSSWSIMIPQALAGVASVLILYRLVKRWQGVTAALIAALVFALTPVVLLMFRYNNPDAFLVLLLLLATWAFWSALEKESGWRLALSGALLGFVFLTKMFEGMIVIPALVIVYLVCAKPPFLRRLLHLGGALVALVAAAGWWVAVVELWPASSRPYIGGSDDNSVLGLALSRTAGYGDSGGMGGGPGGAGVRTGFGGESGWLRMFNGELGGEISWLLPLALLGLLAGLWFTRRGRRTDLGRAGYLLWGMWTLLFVGVFSFANGVLHPYYSNVIGPGLAALVGAGGVALWRLGRDSRWLSWLLPAGIVGSAVWAALLLQRTPDFAPGLSTAVIALGAVGATVLLVLQLNPGLPRNLARVGGGTVAVLAGVALLAGPFAYDVATVSRSITGGLAASGPASTAPRVPASHLVAASANGPYETRGTYPTGPYAVPRPDGGGNATPLPRDTGRSAIQERLVAYLQANQGQAEFLVAARGAHTAAPFIIATGEPVMAMGGFSGGDPAPTLEQFKQMVAEGRVKYVLVTDDANTNRTPDAPGPTAPLPNRPYANAPVSPYGTNPQRALPVRVNEVQSVIEYVTTVGTVVPPREYGGMPGGPTLYYLGD